MTSVIYVINRLKDQDRLASFAASAAMYDLPFERIAAFDGHDPMAPFFLYRDLIGEEFWGRPEIKPGAFACYLSHAAAWRRLLASDHAMALICEDDTAFSQSPSALVAEAGALDGFDVIFANERAADWRKAAMGGDALATAADVLAGLAAKDLTPGQGAAKAPGGDCYLVSRRGAEKLLRYLSEDRVIAGVDWMILRRSAGVADLGGEEWAYLSEAAPGGDLATFIAPLPVAWRAKSPSVLSHRTEMAISDLRNRRAFGDGGLNVAPKGDLKDPVFVAFDQGDFYEAPALEMMRRWMPEGGTFVDIGAHVGNHTLFMLRHGGAKLAAPMEFNPRAIDLLTEMIELNDLDDLVDMTHLGVGLAEDRGKAEAFGSKKNLANNRLREGFVETINTRPGDVLLRDMDVDMIKIDVNGEEREVLKGLRKTMKRKRPVLVLDLSRPKSMKALPLIGRLGYVERERAIWSDADGDRIVAVFTATAAEGAAEGSPPEK